jgi:elongation factor Ts
MEVTAELVRKLREMTGLPMMDCKKALIACQGDTEKAIDWLRKAGLGRIEKMADRTASEGRIACFVADGRAGMIELRCETAPVAKTDDFIRLAALGAQLTAGQDRPTPEGVRALPVPGKPGRTFGDEMTDVFNRLRENLQIARVAAFTGHVGHYIHHDAQTGVLIELSADCPEALKSDICMHIAWNNPPYLRREEADPADVARERELAAEFAKGKPAPVVEKIVDGKLDRWFSEITLLEQPFVKDDKQSVQGVLSAVSPGLTIKRFVRFRVGGS